MLDTRSESEAGRVIGDRPSGQAASVGSITDGDTFVTTDDVRIRFIGIDAPESSAHRFGSAECLGTDASEHLAELLPPGTDVEVVFDVERLDRYGRTLAYIYRSHDGLFINRAMVADGFAQPATYPPNVAHVDDFVEASREARAAGRGLWSDACADGAEAPPTTSREGQEARRCESAYPDACIPSPPPDLDCEDVAERRFRVLPPDPHNFDADRNGLGCENGPSA